MSTKQTQHEIAIRVRYNETDSMGYLHHSNYLVYFELGRTELFRVQGGSYRRMEELKLYFVVAKATINFRRPAGYDDELRLVTKIAKQSPAKLIHSYELFRGDELLCDAETTIACVDADGQVQRIPDDLAEMTGE